MEIFVQILRSHPELAVFLTLGLGFFIGRLRIGSFKLGAMLGTLFAGMIIGQMDISIPPVVKIIFFDLFLFATGYKVGPQFFYGLKKDALPQLILTVVICVSCLLTAFFVSKLLGYDVGTAAGLLAGAFTESTVIGTAADAIQRLSLPDTEKLRLINNIPIAYAVTYLVGTTTLVWFLSNGAPKLLRINLKDEASRMSEAMEMYGGKKVGINSAYEEWVLRVFRVAQGKWSGLTVAEFENKIPGARLLVERIRKDGLVIDPKPDTVINPGDSIVVAARQKVMVEQLREIGTELEDREMMDFALITSDVQVSKTEIAGKSLRELAESYGQGIMLKKLIRGGQEMPFEPGTIVNKGDILQIFGREADVERTTISIGFKQFIASDTDVISVAIGIVLGGLVGLLSIEIGGIAITLSTSGGALVLGLVFGWLHSKTPAFGRIPEPALWIFDTMGLATFLGIIGMGAGPTFISGLKETGLSILLAGVVVALVPHIIGLLVGKYLLRMKPLILLGAQSGAGTTTIALKAIQDASGSKFPVLGYTVPYALGNILLTAWGPVIVSLMTR